MRSGFSASPITSIWTRTWRLTSNGMQPAKPHELAAVAILSRATLAVLSGSVGQNVSLVRSSCTDSRRHCVGYRHVSSSCYASRQMPSICTHCRFVVICAILHSHELAAFALQGGQQGAGDAGVRPGFVRVCARLDHRLHHRNHPLGVRGAAEICRLSRCLMLADVCTTTMSCCNSHFGAIIRCQSS